MASISLPLSQESVRPFAQAFQDPSGLRTILFVVVTLALSSCGGGESQFELLSPGATGVGFANELPEDPDFNILNYLYYYNGGGIAVGDVNNDGLPDLYFTSNLGSNRLYLNRGDYRFQDITENAGVGGAEGWTSGVTMADVNGDGYVDIYVSGVSYLTMRGRNVLYMNNGNGTFTDRTEEYGLGHVGYSTQAIFFDYDGDGDLDMYLLNHSTYSDQQLVSARPRREVRHPKAGDRLFRNDGDGFSDVSEETGIIGAFEGYGLGVVVSDLNLDGCPDLFVANDFQENDFLYLNNCDGTFTESSSSALGHSSRFSMGVDAADFNNDGRPDLVVLDMLPEDEEILKTSANAENFIVHNIKLKAGYGPQYARNTLQLNRGDGRFSEIGYFAGIHATDWSWAPLLADLDNDGHKDLFVTNGIYRRPNDLDYISYVGNDAVQASLNQGVTEENLALLERMPQIPLANYAYRNNGDLTFTNMAESWGLADPGFSSGAAYVDLNNSGALDLVVNNTNAPASIYRNRSGEINGFHHLKVQLHGSDGNTGGIGAKVIIKYEDGMQMLEQMPTRGFQSSVDPRLHFGLGETSQIDTLIVVWPDRRWEVRTDLVADQEITLSQDDAVGRWVHEGMPRENVLFTDVTAFVGLEWEHEENGFYDYSREPLMPHRLSTEGPALAVGDVDGDGLDDIFVGGARGQAGVLFIQDDDGRFLRRDDGAFRADSLSEDVDAVFFDADGDGHLDLYVVSGGNEASEDGEELRDRLYSNDGVGSFVRASDALPDFIENGSSVAVGDFDQDGHLDLFVGGRSVVGKYGRTPRSYLLRNDGKGRFVDVTDETAAGLRNVGMVSAAAWTESDRDGSLDLVVVGEWMPVTVFRQEDGRFVDRTEEVGLSETTGWWNDVMAADVTGNGSEDLVLGNLGHNSYIRASPEEPARLYVHDFSRNGALEQILTFYKNGVSYPLVGRDELVRQIPALRSRYPSYADFGASTIEDIFPATDLSEAEVKEARVFASSLARNNGNGTFDLLPLPREAQFAPVYATVGEDFDGDGRMDLLIAGNFHGVPPVLGRYDASYGLVLQGDGAGGFRSVEMTANQLLLEGQVRDIELLRRADGSRLIIAARNDESLQVLHLSSDAATEDLVAKRSSFP